MEVRLTSEQRLLRDSAAKFAAAAGPKLARGFRGRSPGFDSARLREAGDLGWLGMLVPESNGGLGLGLTELALVLQQAGRALVCEPVGLAAVSAAALALDVQPHRMLEPAMSGAALIVPALQEDAHDGDPAGLRAQLGGSQGAWRLSGRKMFVCADGADGFLVSAMGPDGPALCFVARDAQNCTLTAAPTVDGRNLATLDLANSPADLVRPYPSSGDAVETLRHLALFALSAELLGVMERALEITIDYLRIRKQFGKPIGSFQALQHQAVNAYIRTETVRSLVFQVAANNGAFGIDPALAAAVKARASEDALAVTQTCIQLHGAIGFTDEHDIGLYLKRAMLLSSLFGNAAAQRRRYAAVANLSE
jgi:alkylation response protein AidB-like acyl-CoA dehydrogenase